MRALKRLAWFFGPLRAGSGGRVVRIGYREAAEMRGDPEVAESAASLKWFFAHASVGSNIIDGLADLHANSEQLFPLRHIFSSASPRDDTEPGVIYEHNRGNPGWKRKCDLFEQAIRAGWRAPRVDAAINKLCYVDRFANLNYYLHSMRELEVAFPRTKFVYVTMPLTAARDSANFRRHKFNTALRKWISINGGILFDLADIESHDANGNPCVFDYKGETCERLFDGYTEDGGHLAGAGRQLAAKGFYALAKVIREDKESEGSRAARGVA
ncbi:MAG TPA: hypothetical protein VHH88_03775 [Verrucomicrobiae bacterium]|nr:hypothetical protein [Verrucomicrobiae bacterium]